MICLVLERKNAPSITSFRSREDVETRVVESKAGPDVLKELARIPVDVLVLDVETGPGLGPAVLRYKLSRPGTRIVLLACNKKPGDAEVARVVQAGVYDVVTDPDKLNAVLEKEPAGLEAAAKWLDPQLAPEHEKEKEVVEKVVEKKVAVSNRPVYIAVCGTASGVGTTSIACAVAAFLAGLKYDTVLVEAGEPSLSIIMDDVDIEDGLRPWLPRLDVVRSQKPKNYVRARKWQYVVVDLGTKKAEEATKEDYDIILAVLPQTHRFSRIKDGWYGCNEQSLIFVGVDREAVKYWEMQHIEDGCRMQAFSLPPEIFAKWPAEGEKISEACVQILCELLPEDAKKRKNVRFTRFIRNKINKYKRKQQQNKQNKKPEESEKTANTKVLISVLSNIISAIFKVLIVMIESIAWLLVNVFWLVLPVLFVLGLAVMLFPESAIGQKIFDLWKIIKEMFIP